MWARLIGGALIAGCSYPPLPALGNGPDDDCFAHWMDDSVRLSVPQELTSLSSSGEDRLPWISADGLRLYFSRNPGEVGGSDLYLATRNPMEQDFTKVSALVNLNTSEYESRAALNDEETRVVFSGNHNTDSGKFQIFTSTRSRQDVPFPVPSVADQTLLTEVNTTPSLIDYYDPFLSADGLRLYVAPIPSGAKQQIWWATRAPGQNFGAATRVPRAARAPRTGTTCGTRPGRA
jgi:hypothetical protein